MRAVLVRSISWFPLLLFVRVPCSAWDTPPHQQITKAALDTLPDQYPSRLGAEIQPLIELYCIFPDRYNEMESFGFVRNSPGPRTAAEIRIYCATRDGRAIHGATGDGEIDLRSLVYLLDGVVKNLSSNRPGEAARYAGVLSHFIADTLSPPHAVSAEELRDMTPLPAQTRPINVHSVLERHIPEFTLIGRRPRILGRHLEVTAKGILERCYEGARLNRRELPAMVKAASLQNEEALNAYRLRAGRWAAEILADALYSAFGMADVTR
jgi:hypothetical protein